MLQLHDAEELVARERLVSHHALPFLPDSHLRQARVLLLDDSVIFGSSMARLQEYLSGRGAIVFCAAYAANRTSFYGEVPPGSTGPGVASPHSGLPLRVRCRLWPDAIRTHHASLVRSVLRTPLNYNPDFPTFRLKLAAFLPADVPFISRCLRATRGVRGLFDVSSPASAAAGVFRHTALFERETWDLAPGPGVTCRPYSKARITYTPKTGEVRVTPVVQLAMDGSVDHSHIRFADDTLHALWRTLTPPAARDDPFYKTSLFRLLTAFTALVVGEELLRRIAEALPAELAPIAVDLEAHDLGAILGDANRAAMLQAWQVLRDLPVVPVLSASTVTRDASAGMPTGSKEPEEPNAPDVPAAMVDVCRRSRQFRPCNQELVWESVGKVFLALRLATDSRERRLANPAASRLDVGLTYAGIRRVLEEFGVTRTPDEISLAIDMCVDNGLAVPKVIREGGAYFRAFYCGEDEDDQATLQLQAALHRGYSEFLSQPKAQPLSKFDVQKLCVSLKSIFRWLPVSTGPYKFGWVATVGESGLIQWLTDQQVGPFRLKKGKKRHVLVPREDFVPPVRPTWDRPQSRDFYDAFQYLATAFCRVSDGAKLLLSTCRNHAYAYNAVAFEAHSWAGYQRDSFGYLLRLLRKSIDTGTPLEAPALSALYCRSVTSPRRGRSMTCSTSGSGRCRRNSGASSAGRAARRIGGGSLRVRASWTGRSIPTSRSVSSCCSRCCTR